MVSKGLNIRIAINLQGSTTIKLIEYVDDLVFLSETEIRELQSMTEAFINKSKQMGLIINEEKTKYMINLANKCLFELNLNKYQSDLN